MADQKVRKNKRLNNAPWKKLYGKDRKYTARVDRAMERGEYTSPKE